MKKLLSICFLFILTSVLNAQVSKTVSVTTAGTLSTLLTPAEKTTVTDLTITGNIDARDFKLLRDTMTILTNLDLRGVNILEYNQDVLGYGSSTNPANSIPSFAFYQIRSNLFSKVFLPNNLQFIGFKGFAECYHLTTVITNQYLKSIEDLAFSQCVNLKNIELPLSLESIKYMAFNLCSELSSITLLQNVTYIGDFAFRGCSKLSQFCIFKLNPPIIAQQIFDGVPFNKCILTIPSGSDVLNAYKAVPQWNAFTNIIQTDLPVTYYNISISFGSGGTVTRNLNSVITEQSFTIKSGEGVSFTIVPNAGYEIATITDYSGMDVKSSLVNGQYSFFVFSPHNIEITFKKSQYKISIKHADSGTVNLLCEYGATPSFDFYAAHGWTINLVFYNSTDVTSQLVNNVFTVPAVTNNALLNVSFVSTITETSEVIHKKIKVYTLNSEIIAEGVPEGQKVVLFNSSGSPIKSFISSGEKLSIPVNGNAVYLLKTEGKSYKVMM